MASKDDARLGRAITLNKLITNLSIPTLSELLVYWNEVTGILQDTIW